MNEGAVRFSGFVQRVLDRIVGQAAVSLSPKPGRVVPTAPGVQVAFDDCCAGQLWGRLVGLQPLPAADPSRQPGLGADAVPAFLGTFEVGIVRCAAVFDDNSGRAPSAAQITADGGQGSDDMAAVLSVLRCDPDVRGVVSWNPIGPEGGCHGGAWTFTVWLPNCLEC